MVANSRVRQGSQRSQRTAVLLSAIPLPLALFVRGRVTACNEPFLSLFPQATGKPPLTLTRFLGKEGKARLKSMEWDEDAPDHTRQWQLSAELHTQSKGNREFIIDVTWMVDEDVPILQVFLRDTTEENSVLRELRHAGEQARLMLDALPAAMGVMEGEAIVQCNTALAVLLGFNESTEVVGRNFSSHVSAKFRTRIAEEHRKIVGGHRLHAAIEFQALRKDRSAFPVEEIVSHVRVDGKESLLFTLRDLTPLQEERKRITVDRDEWRSVDEILTGVRNTLDITETCRAMLEHTLRVFSYDFGMVYLPDGNNTGMTATIEIDVPTPLQEQLRHQSAGEGIIGWVIKTAEPLCSTIDQYPPHLPYRSLFASSGVRAIAYVPLRANGSVHAVVMLGSLRIKTHPEHEMPALKRLTDHLGARIASALRYTALREQVRRFETIVTGIPYLLYECSSSGAYIYVSPTVHELVGYAPADFYRNADLWRTLVHPDDRSVFSQRVTGHVPGSASLRLEYRILPKGKATYHWLQDEIHYLRDDAGTFTGLTGIITDISPGKVKEAMGTTSREILEVLASRTISCYAVIDGDLNYVLWDTSLERVTGIRRDEVLHRKADTVAVHLMPPGVIASVGRALEGTSVENAGELPWTRFDPIRNTSGEILAVLCQFRSPEDAPPT
jgi:PAS domain S-box-containing protein